MIFVQVANEANYRPVLFIYLFCALLFSLLFPLLNFSLLEFGKGFVGFLPSYQKKPSLIALRLCRP